MTQLEVPQWNSGHVWNISIPVPQYRSWPSIMFMHQLLKRMQIVSGDLTTGKHSGLYVSPLEQSSPGLRP